MGPIRSDNTVQMFGHEVYMLGADNKKHVERIQGASIEYAYGDEVTTWSEDVFSMLKSRLRCAHSHFDGTCNPDNPNHWVKRFLDSDADLYHQAYVIDDGALPAKVVRELKKEYAGTVYYDRFILDSPPDIKLATIGVDFGGNGSATAFNCTGFTVGFQDVVTLEEYYQTGITSPSELEAAFVDFVKVCKSKYKLGTIYCDSAEQTLIQGLRTAALREGLGVAVKNARNGPINDRIRAYCLLMGADRYKVLRHCTHTIEAFRSAVWDSKSPTKDVRLDDGTYNVDSLDAQEYSTEKYMDTIIKLGVRNGRTGMA